MRKTNQLTTLAVKHAAKPGLYADGGGLYLQVSSFATKSWLFRYMRHGRARKMGLGSVDIVPLADARQRAWEARRALLDGIDPIDARKEQRTAAKLALAKAVTFRDCAERYIAAHESSWRNAKHRAQWKSTLASYAYPLIGDLPASVIDTALVLTVIEPIWQTKPETAGRIRGRIESVLDWAKVRTFRQGENPARWAGHLDHLLPSRSKIARVRHHPAMPYAEVPAFITELQAHKGVAALALEFTILTAARTSAVIGGTLDEVDFEGRVWTVPPERTGTKILGDDPKPRRVPLSDRALGILRTAPRERGNRHLFIGARAGKSLSDMAMLELVRGIAPKYVPHGFRSSFKDWCAEVTHYPNEVSEAALWHVVADQVEAAYRRGDLFEKRVRLMDDWSRYCSCQPTSGVVIPLFGDNKVMSA